MLIWVCDLTNSNCNRRQDILSGFLFLSCWYPICPKSCSTYCMFWLAVIVTSHISVNKFTCCLHVTLSRSVILTSVRIKWLYATLKGWTDKKCLFKVLVNALNVDRKITYLWLGNVVIFDVTLVARFFCCYFLSVLVWEYCIFMLYVTGILGCRWGTC